MCISLYIYRYTLRERVVYCLFLVNNLGAQGRTRGRVLDDSFCGLVHT